MGITRYIGIDVGTSSTIVYVKDYAKDGSPLEPTLPPRAITFNGGPYAPTVIFVIGNDFNQESNFICGTDAESCQLKGKLYHNFKIELIAEDEASQNNAQILLRVFFKWLKTNYENNKPYLGSCDEEKTFVSFPLKWPEELRTCTINAAKDAGFPNAQGVDEASAAIHGLLFSKLEVLQTEEIIQKDKLLNVMLLDMGAGTTDVVIGKYATSKESLQVITTYPSTPEDICFGGREFDEKLCDLLGQYLLENHISYQQTDKARMLPSSKIWKDTILSPVLKRNEELQKMPSFMIMMTNHLGAKRTPFPPISRQTFEESFADKLNEFAQLLTDAMTAAKQANAGIYSNADIDLIVLTGGHSQWYFIADMLMGCKAAPDGTDISFPQIAAHPTRLLQLERPSETVAFGLVCQAMHFEVKDISQYNVWFRAVIGDTEMPTKLLIRRGEILPYKNNHIVYADDFRIRQAVMTEIDLDFELFVKYYLLMSKDKIEDAFERENSIQLQCKPGAKVALRGIQLKAIMKKDFYFQIEDKVSVAIKVSMDEHQQIEVQGLTLASMYEDKRFEIGANDTQQNEGGNTDAI